jgi:hypothetical protein
MRIGWHVPLPGPFSVGGTIWRSKRRRQRSKPATETTREIRLRDCVFPGAFGLFLAVAGWGEPALRYTGIVIAAVCVLGAVSAVRRWLK